MTPFAPSPYSLHFILLNAESPGVNLFVRELIPFLVSYLASAFFFLSSVCPGKLGKKIWETWWNYSSCAYSRISRQDISKQLLLVFLLLM